jgi:hypothetical protein
MLDSLVLVAFVLTAQVTTAVGSFAQSTDRAAITGRIVNRLGCPLVGEFKLRPGTAPFVEGALQVTTSNEDGRFEFRNVERGWYWIHYVLADGGWGGDGVVVAGPEGAHKEFRWPAPSMSDIEGLEFIVTDGDGNPLPGVNVSWRRFSGAVGGPACGLDLTTDVGGRTKVADAPSGIYRVTGTLDGRVPQTRDIKVCSGCDKTATFRLLTPSESARAARTVTQGCISSHETRPESFPQVVSRADAVVVGRLASATLDPVYGEDNYPSLLTRYGIDVTDILKPHGQVTASQLAVIHLAGELEWGKEILVGCEGPPMPVGETYVLFLTWHEQRRGFVLLSGGAFTAKVSTGDVAPVRLTYTAPAVMREWQGRLASEFLSAIRTAARERR